MSVARAAMPSTGCDDPASRDDPPQSTVPGCFLMWAKLNPDKACLVFEPDGPTLPYAAVADGARRMATQLRAAGVGPGAVVMIFLPNQAALYAAILGTMLAGAIPTCMPSPSPRQDEAVYWRDHAVLLARITPAALVTNPAMAAAMRAAGMLAQYQPAILYPDPAAVPLTDSDLARPDPDSVALLQHTSGTTGLKKGIMLSHRAILAQVAAYRTALEATTDDVTASWLPIYHDMGLIAATLMPLVLGQTIIVLDPFVWVAKPALLLQAIARHRATFVWQPNFAFEHLVRTVDPAGQPVELSCVRAFISSSEPCHPETFDRFATHFRSLGITPGQLQTSYGMAETVLAISQSQPGTPPHRLTLSALALRETGQVRPPADGEPALTLLSSGAPLSGLTIRVIGLDGAPCPDRQVGELVVSAPWLFDGYHGLPEQTAERLGPYGLHTRDNGFLADGQVYVLGRMDDVIIVHGRNYHAGEIEAAVSRVLGVRPGRAVAFGVPDSAVGSDSLVILAEPGGDVQAATLVRRIRDAVIQDVGVAAGEVRIAPRNWLAKTTSGKISRTTNKARYGADPMFTQVET